MDLNEKIGQMSQVQGCEGHVGEHLASAVRNGQVGSVINEVDPGTVNELQRIACKETRLGIPLLIGRDVIHGFKTIFPIPLGQAASWDPAMIERAASISAIEASTVGINWTFSPVVDVTRDPRWGRVAETFGEDPFLCGALSSAMIAGYQGDSLDSDTSIAACAKHFVGYGAVESGRDYATTNLADTDLFNTHLPPFKVAVECGVGTIMTSFCDINGVPASANRRLNHDVLKQQWQFEGMTVSDWDAIRQLTIHGVAENEMDCAAAGINAAIDMEMVSTTYKDHVQSLLEQGAISIEQVDDAVTRILSLKHVLGLFENPYTPENPAEILSDASRQHARELAQSSCVLLKNNSGLLPLTSARQKRITIIGPMANDPYEQLGTWIFDGEARHATSCKAAIEQTYGDEFEIEYLPGLTHSRDCNESEFERAADRVASSDVALLFLGEEALLSGEAHCRSDIRLPGAQESLVHRLSETRTPLVGVIMAGRPIVLTDIIDQMESVLFAWHGGTEAGPAIADLLFGKVAPSGKLPITFPRSTGQIPIYYSQKVGGKPVNEHNYVHMNDFPRHAQQTSMGMVSSHMDAHFTPLFPFGFGLTYGDIVYRDLTLDKHQILPGETIQATIVVENRGDYVVEEVVQLYIRDKIASVTRPSKELKGFRKVELQPQQTMQVSMNLSTEQLKFYDQSNRLVLEPGEFEIWLGGDANALHKSVFSVLSDEPRYLT